MPLHPIAPFYDNNSQILILGSFPSVKSRETGFYYGHPQNRFWRICAAVFNENVPVTIDDKKGFLRKTRIALWDVIGSCDISASSDSTISNVIPNDISIILNYADIKEIFVNGRVSEKCYNEYLRATSGRAAVYLPSSSPANAAWSFERLIEKWIIIK